MIFNYVHITYLISLINYISIYYNIYILLQIFYIFLWGAVHIIFAVYIHIFWLMCECDICCNVDNRRYIPLY